MRPAVLSITPSVARQEMNPVTAYDRITDIRHAQEPSVAALRRLWPTECPPRQLIDMLSVMADSSDPHVRDWFAWQIQTVASHGTKSESWATLAQAIMPPS